MDEKPSPHINLKGVFVRKYWFPIILALMLLPLFYTAPHIIMKSENPNGEIEYPDSLEVKSEGLLLVVLDGVGEKYLLSEEYMPELNLYREQSATLEVKTGPLTLSATCINELMTGVPNSPIDGLRNFNLNHPGGPEPWTMAGEDDRYNVAMVGSYVMGNLYGGFDEINFVNTFKGHSDYYEGDKETLEIASNWVKDSDYNVIAAHYSGPDKVGHSWGVTGPEYKAKILDLDQQVSDLLKLTPSNWTVIVTADHGMTEIGSHGSAEAVTRDVAAIISGPGILVGSEDSVSQRDLSTLVPLSLGLPFPVQLHGRIPLEILDYSPSEKESVEMWNWEAAYYRQDFINTQNDNVESELAVDKIDWDEISLDGEFTRDSDIYISIITWAVIGILSIAALGLRLEDIRENLVFFGVYFGTIAAFLVSHASISYSPMISRSIGGICAVWLVAWSLGSRNRHSDENSITTKISGYLNRMATSYLPWCIIGLTLLILLGTITQAVVITLLMLSIFYSINSGISTNSSNKSKLPEYAPWLFAFLAFSFGSIRLWFALLPFFCILIGIIVRMTKQGKIGIPILATYSIAILTLFAVTSIHTRILGSNLVMDAVKMGWPTNLENALFSALLLIVGTVISNVMFDKKYDSKKIILMSSWLVFGLLVSYLSLSIVEQVFVLIIVAIYASSIYLNLNRPKFGESKFLVYSALSMQILLTWGAWSAFVTMIIISCSSQLWILISKNFKSKINSMLNPRTMIAMAVFPWVIWILWWTLLGQVNGLQTCFEGICPHPRELDPGSVIVKGGYVGFREDPHLIWLIVMISSPIILASSMIMYQLKSEGLNLYPYIISQTILILGCMCVLAFSPQYPRLMFTLFWNILFALFQIVVASFAILASKFTMKSDEISHEESAYSGAVLL